MSPALVVWSAVAVANLSIAGCGGDAPLVDDSRAPGEQDEEGDAGKEQTPEVSAEPELPWEACSKYTGEDDEDAECLTVPMPYFRMEDGGLWADVPELDFFVKRLPARDEVRAQLWMLNGGPGFPGSTLEGAAERIQEAHPDLEIYLPDPRGTGRSTLFECTATYEGRNDAPSAEEFYRSCANEVVAEWGPDLAMMSVTEAAYDVTTMMAEVAREEVPIYAWGGSYGCYWLHRVLQVGGTLVDSAIFDSPLRPIGTLSDIDLMLEAEAAGNAVLEACIEDPECTRRLGDTPVETGLEILDGGGDCQALRDAEWNRLTVQDVLVESLFQRRYRGLVAPLLYRLGRCEDEDVAFILALGESLRGRPDLREGVAVPVSFAILPLIHGSEVYTVESSIDDIWQIGQSSLFASLGYVSATHDAQAAFPRYPADRWVGQWAQTDANVLILQGTFDAQTPVQYGREMGERFSDDNQYYFEIKHGSHGLERGSHEVAEGRTCGTHIVSQFLEDPSTRPDGDCADDPPPWKFGASDELLMELLGHTDVWENP